MNERFSDLGTIFSLSRYYAMLFSVLVLLLSSAFFISYSTIPTSTALLPVPLPLQQAMAQQEGGFDGTDGGSGGGGGFGDGTSDGGGISNNECPDQSSGSTTGDSSGGGGGGGFGDGTTTAGIIDGTNFDDSTTADIIHVTTTGTGGQDQTCDNTTTGSPTTSSGRTFKVYTNPDFGIRMQYPSDWKLMEPPDLGQGFTGIVTFSSGRGADLRTYVHDIGAMPLRDYSMAQVNGLRQNGAQIVRSSQTTLAGHPAFMVAFTQQSNTGNTLGMIGAWTQLGNQGYLHFTFVANDKQALDSYLPVAFRMMSSLQLARSTNTGIDTGDGGSGGDGTTTNNNNPGGDNNRPFPTGNTQPPGPCTGCTITGPNR